MKKWVKAILLLVCSLGEGTTIIALGELHSAIWLTIVGNAVNAIAFIFYGKYLEREKK